MKTTIKFLHWTPRIICIIAILFFSLFAFDSFAPNLTFWQQIGAFLMHLIPSYVLIVLLIIAWKWELTGGVVFALIGIGFSPYIYLHNFNMNHSVGQSLMSVLIINFPFFIVGFLFILSYFKKRRQIHA